MTSRPIAFFLLAAAPAAALAQAAGADRLPLVWMWIVAGLVLLLAFGWLLFGGGVRGRRRSPPPPP